MKFTKIKISIIFLSFILVFFVNWGAVFNICTWLDCPDYIGPEPISNHPNFYRASGCGYGESYICWESKFSVVILICDSIAWILINLGLFYLINKNNN